MEFIDFKILLSFCKVAETGSFSEAARELYITQPALSTHISKLEKYLGIQLVERSTKYVELTGAGRVFYKRAKKILKEINDAKSIIDDLKGLKRGVVDIGASTLPGEYILPHIVKKFIIEFPHVCINIHIKDTFSIIDEIYHGNYDFGIVGSIESHNFLEFKKLLDDKIYFVGLNKKEIPEKIEINELRNFPIIAREKGSGTFHTVIQEIGNIDKFVKVTAGSLEAVKNLIKANVGFSFLSIYSIKDELQKGIFKIIQIEKITPIKRNFYFVKKRKSKLSPPSEKFFEMMLKFIKN